MSDCVKFFRHATLSSLKRAVEENLRSYTKPNNTDFLKPFEDGVMATESIKMSSDLTTDIKNPTKNQNYDSYNSVLVYRSIEMTPMQACDERIWAYLSHFEFWEYTRLRWAMPKDNDIKKKVNHVHAHYFAGGHRGLIRDNAIARLWWMGKIASCSKKFKDPIKLLDILFLMSDVRSSLLERNLGMNSDILDAVVDRLNKDYPQVLKLTTSDAKNKNKKIKETLFGRERFRGLMKSLNRIGGYRMLDALEFEQLQAEIEDILTQ